MILMRTGRSRPASQSPVLEPSSRRSRIDVSDHIRKAVDHFGLPAAAEPTLSLHQVEFVIEVVNAEGATTIDNYSLTVE